MAAQAAVPEVAEAAVQAAVQASVQAVAQVVVPGVVRVLARAAAVPESVPAVPMRRFPYFRNCRQMSIPKGPSPGRPALHERKPKNTKLRA